VNKSLVMNNNRQLYRNIKNSIYEYFPVIIHNYQCPLVNVLETCEYCPSKSLDEMYQINLNEEYASNIKILMSEILFCHKIILRFFMHKVNLKRHNIRICNPSFMT
jgi:hypothetical protein